MGWMMVSYEDKPLPFGKYKGELIADLPNGYLEWLLDQEWFEEKFVDLWKLTKKEMGYRERFDIVID